MAAPQRKKEPVFEIYVAPPLSEAGWERLKTEPGVVYHENKGARTRRWKPYIEVVDGFDLSAAMDADDEEGTDRWLPTSVELTSDANGLPCRRSTSNGAKR